MAVIIFLSAIFMGLISRKSKICTVYILVVMYILAAFRTYDADYNTYRIGFQNLYNSTEYRYAGYTLFQKFFYNLGINFNQYNWVFFLIVFLLLFIGIKLLTDNVNIVLSCYMIYSYALDVIQMKSAIANALTLITIAIIIRITYIECEGNKKTGAFIRLIALFCLLTAVAMHFSTLFYVFAIIIYLMIRNRQHIGKHIFFLMIVSFILIFSGFLVVIMKFANGLGIISDIDYLSHWTIKSTRFGFLIYFVIIALIIFSCRFNKAKMIYDEEQLAISNFILTSMLVAPLLYLNGHYSRLLRIYMILMYVFFSRLPKGYVFTRKKLLNYLLFSFAIIIFYYVDISLNYTETLGSLLQYNQLFSLSTKI